MVLGNHCLSTCIKMNLDTDLTTFCKYKSKRLIGLNVKCKIIKLLEDNRGENQGDLRYVWGCLFRSNTKNTLQEINY